MSVIGISIGLVLSIFANRVGAQSLGTGALHPALMAAVAVSMLVTRIAAALLPASRAARIDPQQALRQESGSLCTDATLIANCGKCSREGCFPHAPPFFA